MDLPDDPRRTALEPQQSFAGWSTSQHGTES
jgi:hypothetical protein